MNYQLLLIGSQVAVTVVILLYSSWSDYKTREVSNWVWAIYAPIAIALSVSDLLLFDQSKLVLFGISVGFTVGLSFPAVLFRRIRRRRLKSANVHRFFPAFRASHCLRPSWQTACRLSPSYLSNDHLQQWRLVCGSQLRLHGSSQFCLAQEK